MHALHTDARRILSPGDGLLTTRIISGPKGRTDMFSNGDSYSSNEVIQSIASVCVFVRGRE